MIQSMGKNQRLNHKASSLIAENAQLNKEEVDGRGNKNTFTRVITESESSYETADKTLVRRV